MMTDKQITGAWAGAFPGDRAPKRAAPPDWAVEMGLGGVAVPHVAAEQPAPPAELVVAHMPPAIIAVPELV